MKQDRISQTALKVALGLITLSTKDDWSNQLPKGLVDLTERLLLASGSPGYGPSLIKASKKPWMVSIYQFQDRMMPGQWEAFGHRKIYVNQHVEQAIASGAKQVLILGAGFDTLCLRLAHQYPDVLFVEVDHPATSSAKAKGIALIGLPKNMIQIAADLGHRSLSKILSENPRWDSTVLSILVAEGLFLYLTDNQTRELLSECALCSPKGSQIIFSHKIPGKRKILDTILWLIAEPFKSAVRSEDLPVYLNGTGWSIISGVDTDVGHGIERYAIAQRS